MCKLHCKPFNSGSRVFFYLLCKLPQKISGAVMNNNENNEAISLVNGGKKNPASIGKNERNYWLLLATSPQPAGAFTWLVSSKEEHCLFPFIFPPPALLWHQHSYSASLYVFTGNTSSFFFFFIIINAKRHFQPCGRQTALPSGLTLSY